MDKEISCRKCRNVLNETFFIDIKGNILKTCKNCRYIDSIRKDYKKSRERKRAENEKEFLKRNAEIAKIGEIKIKSICLNGEEKILFIDLEQLNNKLNKKEFYGMVI